MPRADAWKFLFIGKKEHLSGALFLWEKWGSNGRFSPFSYVFPVWGILYFNITLHALLL